MTELLIHSMRELAPLILPALETAGARNIVEIGAEFGGMSQMLADHCQGIAGSLTSIDPSPKPEFLAWVASSPHVHHIDEPSIEAIPRLGPIDAWVIDGDHNYFTVSRELALADANARAHGRPLLMFLHDVGWPWGRRDLYYDPEAIPAGHRQPHSFAVGVTLGDPGFLVNGGFRGGGGWAPALNAGGPGNGVLTAVEDFLGGASSAERRLGYIHVPAVFGLGVVFDRAAPWAEALHGMLAPWHDNPILATLEVNRLRNYLAVIAWQDRQAASVAG